VGENECRKDEVDERLEKGMDKASKAQKASKRVREQCLCVCVCVRERARESERVTERKARGRRKDREIARYRSGWKGGRVQMGTDREWTTTGRQMGKKQREDERGEGDHKVRTGGEETWKRNESTYRMTSTRSFMRACLCLKKKTLAPIPCTFFFVSIFPWFSFNE
jgi:hypothetical protein